MEIITESPLSLVEIKENLTKVKKRDEELTFRGKKVENYLTIVKLKESKDLKDDLEKLNMARLKERHVALIMNIMPTDIESLKAVLSNENLTLKQEDLQSIVKVVKDHA